jgi:hypothetical protein
MDIKILFENLVSAYAKKLEKEKKAVEKKVEEKRIRPIKPSKPLIRTFPLQKPIEIEKISVKELEIKPREKPESLRYSVIEKIPEKKEIKEERIFDFGKLNSIVYNNVKVIEAVENERIIVEYKDGKKEAKEIILSKEEIENLIKKISEKTRLPISEIFEAYFENFFIRAELREKFRFILIKIT